MSQNDKARVKKAASAQAGSPSDVRALAKERARRRARISKRQANRQRGILGAGVLVALCVVLWVLVGVTSLSAVVAGVGTGGSQQRRLQGKRERGEIKRGRTTHSWD